VKATIDICTFEDYSVAKQRQQPLGRDNEVECPFAGYSARDLVSPHPTAELRRHHPRVPKDSRGPYQ
jgi:hypothetical protein